MAMPGRTCARLAGPPESLRGAFALGRRPSLLQRTLRCRIHRFRHEPQRGDACGNRPASSSDTHGQNPSHPASRVRVSVARALRLQDAPCCRISSTVGVVSCPQLSAGRTFCFHPAHQNRASRMTTENASGRFHFVVKVSCPRRFRSSAKRP
jgi:hypothetical protein